MHKRIVYLDNNSTTPVHPDVKATIVNALDIYGNPSSMHELGRKARAMVEDSREKIAKFIGANSDEIVFVGSGSEGNNTVLSIFSCCVNKCPSPTKMRKTIITTKIEHPCILETSKCLVERGTEVKFLDVDKYGIVNIDQLKDLLDENIGLVSVMLANNEIGTIQNIREISELVHKNGSLMHTDAIQAVGKIPVDVDELGVDFLTISGHKIYGPKGIGALYIKKGTPFCPFIRGGHQEKGRRAGTENTLGIIGLGKAIEMRSLEMQDDMKHLLKLKTMLKKGIEEKIPDISFNGHPTQSLPNTLNVSFDGAEGEAILLYLDLEGVCVSTGSACASGSLDPSHVLIAAGVCEEQAHGSVRISLGRENTVADVEYMLDVLPKVIAKIRDMSSAYKSL